MPVDEGSQELEPSESAPARVAAPRSSRQVRARRRRRRRQIGTLLFLIVAVGVFAAAYFVISGGDDSSKSATSASGPSVTTTTVEPPFVATYKATTGLNVRQAPGTTSPTVGTIEQGGAVTVVCVVEGEVVNAPSGPNSQWLKVAGSWPVGYVSSAYVAVGDDLRAQKIPDCPSA